MGENPSTALEDKDVVQRVVAMAPNLKVVPLGEQAANCRGVSMAAIQEVGLSAPMVELKTNIT